MSTSSIVRPGVSIRPGADRHQTRIGWLHGRHSFDTGIDPLGTDTHHGVLVVSNHDTIAPRSGFDTHPHRNMEIVTWVLEGSLVHQVTPGYEQLELDPADFGGRLAVVASGMARHRDQTAIRIRNRYAALHVARLDSGQSIAIPDAPFAHVYLARGLMDLEAEGALAVGDAARLTAAGERRLTATEPSEVLIWEMHAQAV